MSNIIMRTLREIGVTEIFDARDGAEGLKILVDKAAVIDVVLLDLNMPKVSGNDVLKYIRQSGSAVNPDLPVIILTGNAEESTVLEILAMKVSGYLVKPVSKKDLMLRIVKAVAHRDASA